MPTIIPRYDPEFEVAKIQMELLEIEGKNFVTDEYDIAVAMAAQRAAQKAADENRPEFVCFSLPSWRDTLGVHVEHDPSKVGAFWKFIKEEEERVRLKTEKEKGKAEKRRRVALQVKEQQAAAMKHLLRN